MIVKARAVLRGRVRPVVVVVAQWRYAEASSWRALVSVIVSIAIFLAVLLPLFVADFWLNRLIPRALFKLADRLPRYRPGGRYQSQSMPEKYASLRKPRGGG